ncbi:MAG: hypothetical protein R2761_22085 [Acidimicrobiales bacterium]
MPALVALRRLRHRVQGPVPLRRRVRAGAATALLAAVLLGGVAAGTAAFGLARNQGRALDEAARDLAGSAAADRARWRAEAAALAIATELTRLQATAAFWATEPALLDGARTTAEAARAAGLEGLDPAEVERRRPATSSLAADARAQRFLDAAVASTRGMAEASFTDAAGLTGGAVGPADDLVQSDEPWWREVWDYGRWIGAPVAAPEGGGPLLPMAFRIEDDRGEPVGVLRVAVDLAVARSVADGLATDGLALSVATGDGTLIAETATGHDAGRIGQPGLSPVATVPGLAAAVPGGAGSWIRGAIAYGGAPLTAPGPGQADWVVIAEAPVDLSATSSGPLASLERRLGGERRRAAGVVAAGAAAALAGGLAATRVIGRRVAAPVEALASAAQELAARELPAALEIARGGVDRSVAGGGTPRAVARPAVPGRGPGGHRDLVIARGWGREVSMLAAALDTVAQRAVAEASYGELRADRASALLADVAHRHQDQARRQLELVDELAGAAGTVHTHLLHQLAHQVRSGRRQAESLLVLAGAAEPATRTAPVAVERVVAAALSEIDSPQRIVAGDVAPAAVAGSIAADLAHLLSELVANGLDAGGPDGRVRVGGAWEPGAFVLTVADTGPDLDPSQLATLNGLVTPGARPAAGAVPLVGVLTATVGPGTERTPLGLAVVRHLAGQHGLLVRFRARAAGGLQAEVALPRGLALPPPEPTTITRRPADRSLARPRSGAPGRHR